MAGEKPAARMTDLHTCPESDGPVPHVGGPIVKGSPTVLIGMGGAPAPAVVLAADTTTPQHALLTREQVFRRLQDHTANSARKIDEMGDQAYTKRQLDAIKNDERARPRFRGSQIDKEARKQVQKDDDLKERVTGKPNKRPDFIDKETGDQYDMTAEGQLPAHRLKYGDDLMHLDTSGKTIDPQPPMPPPRIAPVSPQGPPPDTAILPEQPDLPIIDDILPLP